jgi:hypothetical protein
MNTTDLYSRSTLLLFSAFPLLLCRFSEHKMNTRKHHIHEHSTLRQHSKHAVKIFISILQHVNKTEGRGFNFEIKIGFIVLNHLQNLQHFSRTAFVAIKGNCNNFTLPNIDVAYWGIFSGIPLIIQVER